MEILRSIDIENEVRLALKDYFNIYCRPLPENYTLPCLLVSLTGGNDDNTIDNFNIVIDSRAEDEETALNQLLDATAALRKIAYEQTTKIRHVVVNTHGSWGHDPVRPEVAMASATLAVYTHKETKTINKK